MHFPRLRPRTAITAFALVAMLAGAIVWILAGRESATRGACEGNIRLIGLALLSHDAAVGGYPPGTVSHPARPITKRLSWYALVTKFLSSGFRLDLDEAWDSGANRVPTITLSDKDGSPGRVVPVGEFPWFRCPAHRHRSSPDGPCPTDYVGIAGLGADAATLPVGHPRAGVFGYERRTRPADIKDGVSSTLLLAETAVANGPWTAGGPATVRGLDPGRTPYIGRGHQFGGTHRGGAMVAFADGSARFIRETVDPRVFEALSTIAGGEQLPHGWDR